MKYFDEKINQEIENNQTINLNVPYLTRSIYELIKGGANLEVIKTKEFECYRKDGNRFVKDSNNNNIIIGIAKKTTKQYLRKVKYQNTEAFKQAGEPLQPLAWGCHVAGYPNLIYWKGKFYFQFIENSFDLNAESTWELNGTESDKEQVVEFFKNNNNSTSQFVSKPSVVYTLDLDNIKSINHNLLHL